MAARRPKPAPASARARKGVAVRTWPRRILGWVIRGVILFLLGSVLLVLFYRFVPPPVTITMLGDLAQGHSINKDWISLSRMDRNMARAAIAAEDGNFCTHHGFDFSAMQKAFQGNVQGRRLRGGSTISQQTAKNVFLWQGRSYVRKGLEAWFTLLIETMWGKRRIMEVYLNVAETGIGTYGANAGAIRYFHHDASRLSPAEAGRIAAVLPLPSKREAIAPTGATRRYGNRITQRIGMIRRGGYDRCLR
ncbi:monofunctional biosynthetic peptidoglycan transglycosylase [uncultured Sphingomonas sp.]|uniref:monofunctional biosynthetic peptidoglycan transglycosylase n=1 Tax=uncultured Sphingomonas sp. TaxID=158754 RepID=UPI0025E335C6|nr:monofunctional biosynthetic peptidoglycan transglycosylase [uncultured Sphingomonas sp.]